MPILAAISRRSLALLLLLAGVSFAAAQSDAPKVTAQPNTVYVSASGKFEAPPDTAVVQFNIAAQEKTTAAAYERASRAAQQVRELLHTNGIDLKAAEIGYFSIAPVFDYTQPKRKVIAFRVSSSVTLKLKDLSKVPSVVEQLSNLDVTDSNSLSYTLDDLDAAKTKAVENAFARARAEGRALAAAGGRSLGEMVYGAVDVADPQSIARPLMAMRAAPMAAGGAPAPTEDFSPRSITVTARVSVVFTLK